MGRMWWTVEVEVDTESDYGLVYDRVTRAVDDLMADLVKPGSPAKDPSVSMTAPAPD